MIDASKTETEVTAPAQAVTLTEKAAAKVQALLESENNPALALRVYVAGGGCSGLQYGMTLDDSPLPDDTTIEQHGIRILVDATSIQYITGSVVDYHEDLMESGFTVENPNAVSSCGCGHSFQTEEGGSSAGGCGGGGGSGGGGCGCGGH